MPEVSVICTVKNGEKHIRETIESIINQTFTYWEFIIVDDGSTDSTSIILSEYAQKDSRINFIPTNGIGRGKALNLAIQNSKGNLVSNIDADDPSHPNRLEIQSKLIQTTNIYDLLSGSSIIIKGNESPKWNKVDKKQMYEGITIKDVTNILPYRNPINHSSVMVKKTALKNVGGYKENIESQFDYDLWVRLAAEGYRLGKVNYPLACKRIHSEQSFETKKRLKYLWNSMRIQKKAIRELDSSPLAYFVLGGRFLFGCLPHNWRISLRRQSREH